MSQDLVVAFAPATLEASEDEEPGADLADWTDGELDGSDLDLELPDESLVEEPPAAETSRPDDVLAVEVPDELVLDEPEGEEPDELVLDEPLWSLFSAGAFTVDATAVQTLDHTPIPREPLQ